MPSSMLGPLCTPCRGLLRIGSCPYLLAQTDIAAHYTMLSRVRARWLSLELALKGSFTYFPLQSRVLFSPSGLPSLTGSSTFSPSQMVSLSVAHILILHLSDHGMLQSKIVTYTVRNSIAYLSCVF